jgi:UDP-glucose 4-epimerase
MARLVLAFDAACRRRRRFSQLAPSGGRGHEPRLPCEEGRVPIAVTGGLGRLGRYVVQALAGCELRILDVAAPRDPPPGFRQADLRDLDAVCAAVAGCEDVVHLGAIDRSFATDDALTMQVNAIGTWNLFEACLRAGVRRVVHCSSVSVTGLDRSNPAMPPCYLPIDEAHPVRPSDAYGLSKRCGELIAEAYARRGLEVLVLRPCLVAFPEMADFMAGRSAPAGRSEPMPFLCSYVGPEDCARAFAAAVMLADYDGFETFFLAAADTFAAEPTVERLEALYRTRIVLTNPGLYADFPRASPVSHTRARERLGWSPATRWSAEAGSLRTP